MGRVLLTYGGLGTLQRTVLGDGSGGPGSLDVDARALDLGGVGGLRFAGIAERIKDRMCAVMGGGRCGAIWSLWPLMAVLLALPLGCNSSVVVGHGGPHAAPPLTIPDDCPQVSSAPRAVVDYVDAIEANGRQYAAQPSIRETQADLGSEQFRVRCSFAQLNTVTGRETPQLRNGDSTFLTPDTPVYAVKGWSPLCRLAAPKGDGSWKVYFALVSGAAVAAVNPCAIKSSPPG